MIGAAQQRLCVAVCVAVGLSFGLAACGTSAYCTAVEDHRAALDDVTVSTEAFTDLAASLRAIEEEAPADMSEDYAEVAGAIEALLEAESATGVSLEDLTRGDIVDLSEEDTTTVEQAYRGYADTVTQRRAITTNLSEECGTTLKTPADQAQ